MPTVVARLAASGIGALVAAAVFVESLWMTEPWAFIQGVVSHSGVECVGPISLVAALATLCCGLAAFTVGEIVTDGVLRVETRMKRRLGTTGGDGE